MNTKISARDFFLHLGTIVTFYASAIALITLLFEAINFAYPKITNAYQYYFPSISLQVATLIVAFPLFLLLSWVLQKTYEADPSLREAPLRKWLSYVTLFVAGAVVAGDLVTVIYMFLDGQEITTAFLLKVLTLVVIAGGVFIYYLREIRNVISPKERNIWRIAALLIIVGSIIAGFLVIGSPRAQREYRFDAQRVSDLQNLQWQVVSYWQGKEALPQTIEEINDPIRGGHMPADPVTGERYEYRRTGNLSFEVCATFARESRVNGLISEGSIAQPVSIDRAFGSEGENWQHPAGHHCYERTIDPDFFPPTKSFR